MTDNFIKKSGIKTALVHDWLTGMRGGEKALEAIYELYPSPVYTLLHTKNFKSNIIDKKRVISSSIQKIPFSDRIYRGLIAFFPRAIEEFDLSQYDLVLSTSHAVAKGVLTNSNQLHICYMHTPIRYAWDLYFQYLKELKLETGPFGWYFKKALHRIRTWDIISSGRVDHYLTNSSYVARRIKKIYNRDSKVIYGPADVRFFECWDKKENYYLTASNMAPYKKIDLIVSCFKKLPEKKLIVIGDGGDFNKIKKITGNAKNIELLGYQTSEKLKYYLQRAKAFVFAAEEDFGLLPIEAQACGTPVIAFGRGGVTETVLEGKTGIFFDEQSKRELYRSHKAF